MQNLLLTEGSQHQEDVTVSYRSVHYTEKEDKSKSVAENVHWQQTKLLTETQEGNWASSQQQGVTTFRTLYQWLHFLGAY